MKIIASLPDAIVVPLSVDAVVACKTPSSAFCTILTPPDLPACLLIINRGERLVIMIYHIIIITHWRTTPLVY